MKNLLLSLFVCLPALAFAQNSSQCGTNTGTPPPGGCCYDCTCIQCGAQEICANLPGADPANCVGGFCNNCFPGPTTECGSWTANYYSGTDLGCVPIDGGLGFLIAGGLGMGVLGVRRRKELELEA